MLIWLLVDVILQPKYLKWSTNFRSLLFTMEMAPSCLKYLNSVLPEFTLRLMTFVAPGYVADIQLAQIYLEEVLDHLHGLHL